MPVLLYLVGSNVAGPLRTHARYHIDCAERIGVPGGEATNKIQASGAAVASCGVWSAKMCEDSRVQKTRVRV